MGVAETTYFLVLNEEIISHKYVKITSLPSGGAQGQLVARFQTTFEVEFEMSGDTFVMGLPYGMKVRTDMHGVEYIEIVVNGTVLNFRTAASMTRSSARRSVSYFLDPEFEITTGGRSDRIRVLEF